MTKKANKNTALLLGGAAVAGFLYLSKKGTLGTITPVGAGTLTPATNLAAGGYVYNPSTGLYVLTNADGSTVTYDPTTASSYTTPAPVALYTQQPISTPYAPVTPSNFTVTPNPATGIESGTPTVQTATPIGPTITQLLQNSLVDAVTAEYKRFYNRAPDTAGLAYWVNMAQGEVNAGKTWAQIASELQMAFATSAEATQTAPATPTTSLGQALAANITNAVTSLYSSYYGRAPDSLGLSYWVGIVNNERLASKSWDAIGEELTTSFASAAEEARQTAAAQAAAATAAQTAANQLAAQNAAAAASAAAQAASAANAAQAAAALQLPATVTYDTSKFYSTTDAGGSLSRYVGWAINTINGLYNQYLHRAPDSTGMQYWLDHVYNLFASRMSQADVLNDLVANFSKPGLQGYV